MRNHIAGGTCLLLISLLLAACGSTEATTADANKTPSVEDTASSKPMTSKQRLKAALDDAEPAGAGMVKVLEIDYGKSLTVELKTPEGGFEGASTHDLDNSAAAVFKAVYGVADYPATKETVAVFKGGLVDTETGKDLPDVNTAIYTIKGRQANRIDWDDDDAVMYNIDWSNYRDFVHPAIKSE